MKLLRPPLRFLSSPVLYLLNHEIRENYNVKKEDIDRTHISQKLTQIKVITQIILFESMILLNLF